MHTLCQHIPGCCDVQGLRMRLSAQSNSAVPTDLWRHGRQAGAQVAAEARLPLADDVPGVPAHDTADTGFKASLG